MGADRGGTSLGLGYLLGVVVSGAIRRGTGQGGQVGTGKSTGEPKDRASSTSSVDGGYQKWSSRAPSQPYRSEKNKSTGQHFHP